MLYVLRLLFLFIMSLVFSQAIFTKGKDYQQEGEEFAKGLIKRVNAEDLENILEQKEKLKAPKGEVKEGDSCNNCVHNLENPNDIITKIESEMERSKKEILVFVSFSMPALSLKALSRESKKYNAKLVLRGLYKDSFKKTAEKILEIDEVGLNLGIDPKLFKIYKIKKVPTFILIDGNREISRLSGNVTLEYAKMELEKE